MRLSEIIRYPIKSCRGTSVARAWVGRRGIEHDRRWMIVDDTGRFVTQREEHRLALVDVTIDGDDMLVSAREHSGVTLPLVLGEGDPVRVGIWRSEVDAVVHPLGSAWFAAFLGREVRLVYMQESALRGVNPKYGAPEDVVSFADGYPLLLTSEGSLRDLGDRIEARGGERVPMIRFRPNVVVTGVPPWDEDAWGAFTIGGVPFRAPKPCDRCVITTIDPETARAESEPLRTLATFRRWSLPSQPAGVWFGVNLVPDEAGPIAVGDAIVVTARRALDLRGA